jgi:hypothetical protein
MANIQQAARDAIWAQSQPGMFDIGQQAMNRQLQAQAARNQQAQLMGAMGPQMGQPGTPQQQMPAQGAPQGPQNPAQGQPQGVASQGLKMPGLTDPYPTSDPYAGLPQAQRQQMAAINHPDKVQAILQAQGLIDERTGKINERHKEFADHHVRMAASFPAGSTQRNQALAKLIRYQRQNGMDSSQIEELYGESPEIQDYGLQVMAAVNANLPPDYRAVIDAQGNEILANINDPRNKDVRPRPQRELVRIEGNKPMPTEQQVYRDDMVAAAKDSRTYVSDVISSGRDANTKLANNNRMLDLLKVVETGFGAEGKMKAQKILEAFGVKMDLASVPEGEELMALMGSLVMDVAERSSGSISDTEMRLFASYTANFGNTAEGNKNILKWQRAQLKRDVHLAKMAREMRKRGQSSPVIEDAIWNYIANNSLNSILEDGGEEAEVMELLRKYGNE